MNYTTFFLFGFKTTIATFYRFMRKHKLRRYTLFCIGRKRKTETSKVYANQCER